MPNPSEKIFAILQSPNAKNMDTDTMVGMFVGIIARILDDQEKRLLENELAIRSLTTVSKFKDYAKSKRKMSKRGLPKTRSAQRKKGIC